MIKIEFTETKPPLVKGDELFNSSNAGKVFVAGPDVVFVSKCYDSGKIIVVNLVNGRHYRQVIQYLENRQWYERQPTLTVED